MTTALPAGQDIARFTRLLSDPTRAAVCSALMDGRAWTAGELASVTGVGASIMSEHLTQLVAGGLLREERQGRYRYVRLAGPEIAELLELVGNLAGRTHQPGTGYRRVRAAQSLREARTCYDHLAGELGLAVTDAMVARGFLLYQDSTMALTERGRQWLDHNGVALDPSSRRPEAKACLDWTERRHHLAGRAGAAVCTHLFEIGGITRGTPKRAVRLTDSGRAWLQDLQQPVADEAALAGGRGDPEDG
jgi:DNA-binding transcriptional ArsR family regulator